MEKDPIKEATQDSGRTVVFTAISTIATYAINQVFPDLPLEVQGAILVLILAGITYLDSYIHNRKDWKANGLTPF